MPGRLRRLNPVQPRSERGGPATRHGDPVHRADQQLAQPCADFPESTCLIGRPASLAVK